MFSSGHPLGEDSRRKIVTHFHNGRVRIATNWYLFDYFMAGVSSIPISTVSLGMENVRSCSYMYKRTRIYVVEQSETVQFHYTMYFHFSKYRQLTSNE